MSLRVSVYGVPQPASEEAWKRRIQDGQERAIRQHGKLSGDEVVKRVRAGRINPFVAAFLLARQPRG